jgi:tetratricopeptide (TPR) repeat protein
LQPLLILPWLAAGLAAQTLPPSALAPQTGQARDFLAAEAAYEKETQLRPSPLAWQRLGLSRHLQNKFDSAIPAFRSAIQLDPALWTSHLFLGICLYRTNRFEEAESSLQIANRLAPPRDPGRDDLEFWLGATLVARRNPLAGLQFLERLLTRNPKHTGALELATRAYAEASIALWNDVAERDFESPAGWEVHGHALQSEGNASKAIEAFRRSRQLAPHRPGPGLALGFLLLREGKPQEAFTVLAAEAKLPASAPEARFYAGLAAMQLKNYPAAIPLLRAAAKNRPANPEIPLALAQVYLALAQPTAAVPAAQRAVALAPRSPAAHEILLAVLELAGLSPAAAQERLRWQSLPPQP